MWKIITISLLLATVANAEVWEKPKYEPDENHLPSPEVQKQEERREKQKQEEKKKEDPQLYKEIPKKITPRDP